MTPQDDLQTRLAALSPERRALLERLLAGSGDVEAPIRPREAGRTTLPLSYEQERLWFMDRLLPNREVFHVPTALRLRGDVDVAALRAALTALVARHEVLRTVFAEEGGAPVQRVLPRLEPPLRVADASGAADPDGRALELATETILEPFDLGAGPLIRAGLYRVAPREHLFVIVQHHIVSDYWSLGILLADLGALYGRELGLTQAPPAPSLHYADFARWQRETLTGDRLAAALDFWRETLDGAPELLDLPTDRPRSRIRHTRGEILPVAFDGELVQRVRALAKEAATTLTVAFLAGYVATLSRHVRQDDIVVGVPIAGRGRPETQQMIGYFLNWLPVRVHVGDGPGLRVLVARVRDAFAAAFARQDLPFEMLVQTLQPPRHLGTTPVFQTSFSLRDAAPEPPALPGLTAELADLGKGATHYDLMAELWCEGERVVGYLPYNDELFDAETVARFARRMTRLLAEGTLEPDRPVRALPLLGEDGTPEASAVPPSREVDAAATLHGWFAEVAAATPAAVAVVCEDERLTYAELDERANRLAHALRERGAGPGRCVGVCLERSSDLVVGLLGVLKSGAGYVPLDPDNPAARSARQLSDTAAVAVVTTAGLADRLPGGLPAVRLDADAAELAARPATPPAVRSHPLDLAYVIHTSGSTGLPKGVAVTHANVVRLLRGAQESFGFGPDDVWTLFHSCAFDFSVWELWGSLLNGGRLVVVPHWMLRAPDELARLLAAEGVTVLNQTPSAFAQLSRVILRDEPDLALRHVVFGGEALDPASLAPWIARYGDASPRLVNMYGITETTVHVTYRPITRADLETGGSPIGEPLPDLGLYVLDGLLRPALSGVVGELYVGGAGLARCYVADPARTADRMLPDPYAGVPGARMYRTGDLARRLPSGEVLYQGRADDQVKIRGHRIELGEIQAALGRLPGVAGCAVAVRDDGPAGPRLSAYVVPADGAAPSAGDLRRGLLATLPEWMVPALFVTVDALPLTRNGKLDHRALRALDVAHAGRERPHVPPRGETEQALAAIWRELLDVGRVGVDDGFFELGGHSLMAVQLVSLIRERLGAELPIAVLFQHPTLEAMAGAVDAAAAGEATTAVDTEALVADLSEAEVDAMLAALGDDG
ncbi:amino acid adenylation domain-containing protein [Streptosporangium becharense]|uniref:Amino acid adenylation domain-containing protein n=1 Tax=Streptosporangium becharense TaxID=1816182 RepID=A0A7W9INA7_9ACTN|nr:non-ribosomal peptide synthetase [Streptosporangium becharense]MBB2910421.1 amino acid adenylation domain-containing protein [Streptosporangium becharense]MBB5823164.1 amino acid adenylation domain-containing protein [Streptosporangium becharense]